MESELYFIQILIYVNNIGLKLYKKLTNGNFKNEK